MDQKLSAVDSCGADSVRIDVNTSQLYQTIEGFGASLTNAAAYLIHTSEKREEIIKSLFSNGKDGVGISYIRLPMGGTDFQAISPGYTYDEVPDGKADFDLKAFSIAKDKLFVIPVLQSALKINPDLKIMATPWSAPGWMKSSLDINKYGKINHVNIYANAYAEYFIKFIKAYAKEGINFDAITIQNEPDHSIDGYPTMKMSEKGQADFIRKHLGPALRKHGLKVKILIWDHNWDNTDFSIDLLKDPQASEFIAGSAWHCYKGLPNATTVVHDAHPKKDIYYTECSGGYWDNNFGHILKWSSENLLVGGLRNWAKTALFWNLALDEHSGPTNTKNGCKNCRGVITILEDGSFELNPEYYLLGQFAKFFKRGARRVWSSEEANIISAAARNPDGQVVVFLSNVVWGPSTPVCVALDDQELYEFRSMGPWSILTLY